MTGYTDWVTFKIGGRQFLSLENGRDVTIYGRDFTPYGSYRTTDSFKTMYTKQGEALNLTPTTRE